MLSTGVLLASRAVQAGEVYTAELAFQGQALDLGTGTVIEVFTPMEAGGGHVTLAYNALRPTRAVVIPAGDAEIVLFEGLAFDGVSSDLAVARRQFVKPESPWNQVWGTPLYFLSQMVLAGSLALV